MGNITSWQGDCYGAARRVSKMGTDAGKISLTLRSAQRITRVWYRYTITA